MFYCYYFMFVFAFFGNGNYLRVAGFDLSALLTMNDEGSLPDRQI